MNQYLYVCHFSNGHIKVGRSIDPVSRIAQHADRVACMGVELIEHHISECVGYIAPSESDLIERCAAISTRKNNNEWFEGVDYLEACRIADDCAQTVYPESVTQGIKYSPGLREPRNGIEKAVLLFGGSHSKLATAIGGDVVRQNVAHWLKAGRVPADQAPDVEKATGIKCEELCPGVSWGVLRRKPKAAA